jgi:hypothetical protein
MNRHVEALESRQFFSATPVATSAPVKMVAHAATTAPVQKLSFVGTYTGKLKSDFGKTTVILIITNETKSSIEGTLELFGQTYDGTFRGAVIPGKQFDVKKSTHGADLKFKGYLSTDGKEFKGRLKSSYFIFSDETKFDLKRVL